MKAGIATIAAILLAVGIQGDPPLTLLAPAAPGGGWDQTARAMQHAFAAAEPGASVQVENVAGAAGTIGLARFVSAERGNPDALLVVGLVMVSAIVTNNAPVSLAETTPIARLTGEYEVIVVPAQSKIRSLGDLITAFKASPAAVTWGGGSAGGTDDLLVRLMAEAVGLAPSLVNYIAFPGGGAALAALLGGQVTAGVSGYAEFAGQIEAGTLRLLAVSAPTRVTEIDAPTLREQGVDVDLSNWRGVVAPPGLSDLEREALTARIERMAASPAWRTALARNGWADLLLTGPTFRQFLIAEQQRVEGVLQRLGPHAQNRSASGTASFAPMLGPYTAFTLLGILVIVHALNRARLPRNLASGSVAAPRRTRRAFALAGTLAAHSLLLPVLGFIAASTILFAIAAWLFGSHRWRRDLVIGLVTSIVLFVIFTSGLGLSLPLDPATRWYRG